MNQLITEIRKHQEVLDMIGDLTSLTVHMDMYKDESIRNFIAVAEWEFSRIETNETAHAVIFWKAAIEFAKAELVDRMEVTK